MKLDLVHDIQTAYRGLLDSMSRPGSISNMEEQSGKVDIETGCFPSTAVLALMLLDTEVSFKVFSEREDEITKIINQLTYAKAADAKKADFIFVLDDALPGDLEEALVKAKTGDLINPHESATVIVEADSVTSGEQMVLSGPGIEKECFASVSISGNWEEIRAEKNVEFPLGIDLIFTDSNSNLLCLPRTTQISQRVVG
jgi:alpha-D-ribose 1-methylphosphonate 5-triphosphate synthase subunit PhnH